MLGSVAQSAYRGGNKWYDQVGVIKDCSKKCHTSYFDCIS
jgi:hypothetical protein